LAKMIINGSNLLMGRLASFAARKALEGEQVTIVNCKKVYVSGSPKGVLERYKRKFTLGTTLHGPFISRNPGFLMRRSIRGMLPWNRVRGREAFRRVKCYPDVPEALKGKPTVAIEAKGINKLPITRYITLGEVCARIGTKRDKK